MKTFKKLFLLFFLIALCPTASAIQYCDYSMTASSRTIAISFEQPTATNYKITIKSAAVMTGIHDGWYMNITQPVIGNGNVQVKNFAVLSGDAKTITITFTSTTTPSLYTQIHVLFNPTTGADLALYPVPPTITWGVCATTPSVTTSAATAVGTNAGTMNGNIASNGGFSITSYGFYWSTTSGFADGAGTQVAVGATDFTGNIASTLSGLTSGVTYYYKAYATNSSGPAYGAQQSFTTTSANPPPTLTSPTVTAITNNSATLGANITSIGGSALTARGTSYKTATPVVATDAQLAEGGTAAGVFTQSRVGLSGQTRYYYVGYATNSTGTAISTEGNFRTLSNPATIQPATFTATAGPYSLTANWGAATFPASGATRAGYLVIYSAATPSLTSVNGTAPTASGTIVNISSTLPTQPALTTAISGLTAGTLYNLLIVPYTWDGTNTATYNYFISGAKTTSGTPTALPAAPTPPARLAADVIRVYTDAYSTSPQFTGNWGQSSVVTPVPGDNVRYVSNTFSQIDNAGYSITGMTRIHVDIFVASGATQMRLQLGAQPSSFFSTPNGQWTSVDIDITAAPFNSPTSVNIVSVQTGTGAAAQYYYDNVYFYKPSATAPTLQTFTIDPKVVGDPNFTITPPGSNSNGAWSYTSGNSAVATIVNTNQIQINGAGTSVITATQAADGPYTSGTTSTSFVVTPAPLSTPAPTPPARNAWDVVSLYSDAYTPFSALACQNQATTTDVQLQGNETKKMENFNIEIFTFNAANLTAMTTLHLDVYSEDCNAMNVWLLNNGDKAAQLTITSHSNWNSIDIPLTAYTGQGLNMNGVFFVKFESLNGGGKTVFIDNFYFYRPATLLPPTITDFSIPTKAYNDADFVIPPPTSNSSGAFTYTSSNTAVAEIVNGNMIDVIGGGITTITATQSSEGIYGPGEITTQFTVTFPAPPASPTPPARTPDRVISLFTGNPPVYANAITPVQASWSPTVVMTEIPNGTNTALKLDNFGFLGLIDQAEVRFNVSAMSHLHIDIYLNEPLNTNPVLSRVNIYLLANGDYLYMASNLHTGWNSLSIPMSNFSGADLTQAWGLKLESINPATQIYIDNAYFSNECYTYYADADQDGFGNLAAPQTVCDGSGAPTNYVLDSTDCNDSQLQYADLDADGFGGSTLVACGVDNHDDCDDGTVRYADNDNDGFGSLVKVACDGVTNNSDCDDNLLRYADTDGDGYGSLVKVACGGVLNNTDCNDTKSTVHPNAPEVGYNLIDDDCDGQTDEGFPVISTTIMTGVCNTTLPTIDSYVYANVIPGANGYRWRVTRMVEGVPVGAPQFLDTALRQMKITQLASYAFNTQYKIEVAVYYAGGFLQAFTPSACTVTTPATPTQLITCSASPTVLTSVSDIVYATNIPFAVGYRFKITDAGNSLLTQELLRPVREFRMNMITAFPVQYNRVYNVQVSIKNTDGTYLPFVSTCQIKTPVFPTAFVQDSQCDGYSPATLSTPIYAVSYPGAIGYAFNLSGNNFGVDGVEVIKTTRSIKLSDFPGIVSGATYNIRVRLIFNTNDPVGPYGKTCTVNVPALSRTVAITNAFDANAYPNPFADNFNIDVTTSASEKIEVKVYDMMGRLLEYKSTAASEMETLWIGEKFPSGVYNVIVSQGDQVKTLRVIKR